MTAPRAWCRGIGDWYADFYLPANRALTSVSELRVVQGMTAVVAPPAPLVTVWPESGNREHLTALPVLRAQCRRSTHPGGAVEVERTYALRREAALPVPRFLPISLEGQPLRDLSRCWTSEATGSC